MRCWQYQGFNSAAMLILDEKVQVGIKRFQIDYTDGRPEEERFVNGEEPIMESAYTSEVYDTRHPFYEDVHDLQIYRFKDGRILEDYVQEEPWSSGPCTFMALRDHDTKEPLPETLWSQEIIDNC